MRDFTLKAYTNYLKAVQESGLSIMSFIELLSSPNLPEEFFVIRHDVDRKPKNALRMATLESDIGIKSTYYFRSKDHVFKPDIILSICELGHDIGYHYECLADSRGSIEKALVDFEKNLQKFRSICDIKTISMHGSPLSSFNNLDLWYSNGLHNLIKERFQLLGEITINIDYNNIAYINDTGRNWRSDKSNLRDKVNSIINVDFVTSKDLYNFLISYKYKDIACKRVVFQIHPERWHDNQLMWSFQLILDFTFNKGKDLLRLLRQ